MRVLITGGKGQLAHDLIRAFATDDVVAPSRAVLDIADAGAINAAFERHEPEVVLNTAAFHKVDLCESEPESSFALNAAAPQRLSAACRDRGALFVHFSTDYVFDGEHREPYRETDRVNPVSVYGASKAAGEMAIRATNDRHLIVRTTGLYGIAGMTSRHGNFVETMLRLAGRGEPIGVVGDQVLTPTYTPDLALTVARLVRTGAAGTFHVTSSGQCSWYEFAEEIFRQAGVPVQLQYTTQAQRPVPARRPAYSVLGHEGLIRAGVPDLRHWRDALGAYLASRASAS